MAGLSTIDLVTMSVSCLLTLMILSYTVRDNPLFRLAVYIFVGVSAGYAGAVAWYQVLLPRLLLPLISGNFISILLAVVPLVLGVLLLMKISAHTARLGNISMAYLVGVGAAVAIGGAVMGTIFPQSQATMDMFSLNASDLGERFFEGSIILAGTLSTLIYFHFGAKATPEGPRRNNLVKVVGWIGQGFIAITFGVLFAGAYAAAMTALIERLSFILTFLRTLITGH